MSAKRSADEMIAGGGANPPFDVCEAMASSAESALSALGMASEGLSEGSASNSTFQPAIETFLHELVSSADVEFETWLSQAKRQQDKTGVINGENHVRAMVHTTTQLVNEIASTFAAMVQAGESRIGRWRCQPTAEPQRTGIMQLPARGPRSPATSSYPRFTCCLLPLLFLVTSPSPAPLRLRLLPAFCLPSPAMTLQSSGCRAPRRR